MLAWERRQYTWETTYVECCHGSLKRRLYLELWMQFLSQSFLASQDQTKSGDILNPEIMRISVVLCMNRLIIKEYNNVHNTEIKNLKSSSFIIIIASLIIVHSFHSSSFFFFFYEHYNPNKVFNSSKSHFWDNVVVNEYQQFIVDIRRRRHSLGAT